MGVRSLLLVALLAGTAAAQSTNVSPEQKQKARDAYAKATQHFDLTEYKEALDNFKEAYRNFPEPTFLFNIAQCHRQLGEKEQAIRFYKTYLSKVPNAPNRVEVQVTIGKLETALANEKSAQSGKPMGIAPPPPPIAVESKPVEAKPVESKPVEAKPVESKPVEAKPVEAKPVEAKPVEAKPVESKPVAQDKPTPVYKKWWLWTIVGVVVVGAAVGVGLGLGLQPSSASEAMTDLGSRRPF